MDKNQASESSEETKIIIIFFAEIDNLTRFEFSSSYIIYIYVCVVCGGVNVQI